MTMDKNLRTTGGSFIDEERRTMSLCCIFRLHVASSMSSSTADSDIDTAYFITLNRIANNSDTVPNFGQPSNARYAQDIPYPHI
ncbi:hypothetical protein CU097_013965 [Rhizopus azygosporus]|uniref:Uncharacterized protein n=1 Tax=Rhizopus azygosporus TaxID=86630 RepID=A0A367K133_RHIAZ|nr:hypothetical protein CU097_013965 [Rhizopus azygosporus]